MTLPRICIVCSQFYPIIGGTERQVQRLAEKLAQLGQPVFVLTTQPGEAPQREIINGVQIYRYLPGGSGGGRIVSLGRTISLICREMLFLFKNRKSYDLIHVQQAFYMTLSAIIAAKLLKKKVIFKIACGGELGDLTVISREKWSRLKLRLLRSADAFIAISSQIEQELKDHGFPGGKIVGLPNGVDIDRFRPVAAAEKQELKKKLALPEKDIVVSVTRTDRQKQLDVLLTAWNLVSQQEPDLHLVFIVSNAAGECERLKKENYCTPETITYQCRIDNVEQYLQASDIFVLNSLFEGLPNAVLEAMACELPVIGTAVGGTTDIIRDGETGVLIAPGDAAILAQAIISLYHRKEQQRALALKAKNMIREKFALEKVADRYIELYRRILA